MAATGETPQIPHVHICKKRHVCKHKIEFRMYEILPRLYISSVPTEVPSSITHVLNMRRIPNPPDPTRTYLHIPLNDNPNITPITPHLQQIVDFIHNARQNDGRVLIHCKAGVNRSAAAMLAYICHREKISSEEALEFLKQRKPDVQPWNGFLQQVNAFFKEEAVVEDVAQDEASGEKSLGSFCRRWKERTIARLDLEHGQHGGISIQLLRSKSFSH